jgi:hypothetical protein
MTTINGYEVKPKDKLHLQAGHTYFISMGLEDEFYCYHSIPWWVRVNDFIRRVFHAA